jgi:hypothetical protein
MVGHDALRNVGRRARHDHAASRTTRAVTHRVRTQRRPPVRRERRAVDAHGSDAKSDPEHLRWRGEADRAGVAGAVFALTTRTTDSGTGDADTRGDVRVGRTSPAVPNSSIAAWVLLGLGSRPDARNTGLETLSLLRCRATAWRNERLSQLEGAPPANGKGRGMSMFRGGACAPPLAVARSTLGVPPQTDPS